MDKNKEHINKELEEIAPLLSKMKKEEGYKIPFNYFEKMEDDIMSQLFPKEETVGAVPQTSWWENAIQSLGILFRPRLVMAVASVTVIILAGYSIWGNIFTPGVDCDSEPVACITLEDIESYIDNNIDDFDIDMLAESKFNEFSEPDLIDIDPEALDRYIDENILETIDLNTLEELL
ncbi:MAG: hypothetical protein AAF502_03175 [Bacteroidota bacterium]